MEASRSVATVSHECESRDWLEKAFQLAIVPEIAISPSSSLELFLGPKGNGVTKSSLLLQLDHCSTRWVIASGLSGLVFLSGVDRPNSKIRENLFPEDMNKAIRLPRFWVEPIAGVDP
ncbi:unnamed protein product [Lupinus luteus]|uniref:Uncharacterized protein n=1 Tax=Lupinus luteus TaxID=3873 RepID=A0AAV1YA65_LUPLU